MNSNTIKVNPTIAKRLSNIVNDPDLPEFFSSMNYLQQNTKLIFDAQHPETWTQAYGTVSSDTSIYLDGFGQTIKALDPGTAGDGSQATKNNLTLDLTKFANGSASTTADKILWVFKATSPFATIANTSLAFCPLATFGGGDTVYYPVQVANIKVGWNYILVAKSAFTVQGAGVDWASIQSLRCSWGGSANSQNVYLNYQLCMLIKAVPAL